MRAVAFIPARAGSKGVPRKNVRLVGGKPLIALTIESALASRSIGQVVVTTDCAECSAVAANYPVILVNRPPELADDTTPTFPVVEHAMKCVRNQHALSPEIVVLLQCTSPFRTARHIDGALSLFDREFVQAVISVCSVGDAHPARMYRLDDVGQLLALDPRLQRLRRQDLPPLYHRNGAIYAARVGVLKLHRDFIVPEANAYLMDDIDSINIDTELDLLVADAVFRRRSALD
jgi:CMP-N-acetylneuraminic acid synthetase